MSAHDAAISEWIAEKSDADVVVAWRRMIDGDTVLVSIEFDGEEWDVDGLSFKVMPEQSFTSDAAAKLEVDRILRLLGYRLDDQVDHLLLEVMTQLARGNITHDGTVKGRKAWIKNLREDAEAIITACNRRK